MIRWTLETITKEALKYKNRNDFKKKSHKAYMAAQYRHILDEVCSHMNKSKTKAYSYSELQEEALLYSTKTEFRKNSLSKYDVAYKMGILDEICNHMVPINNNGEKHPGFKWTRDLLKKEALKYSSKPEFRESSPQAYDAAYKKAILNDICSHMDFNLYRSVKEVELEALKYQTRLEFQKFGKGAYQAAQRLGILDQVCAHMKLSINTSLSENELFNTIKQIYPKAQKLRDRKLNVSDKSHIYGFDIDIYIPELRKGIEFDGKYWHSINMLKRGRPNWPDEDLKNYHNLKDEYFANKGIKLLHIKEEDWLKDKQNCINKCLEFLKTETQYVRA